MAIRFVDLPAPPDPPKAETAKKKRAPKGSFDRNAYQRELMRKRRAAEKAAKGA